VARHFVANDGLYAYLYHNEHNGILWNRACPQAWQSPERADHGGDVHFAGRLRQRRLADLYISDFQKSSDHLWHNSGKEYFDEVSGHWNRYPRAKYSALAEDFRLRQRRLADILSRMDTYPEVEQVTPDIHPDRQYALPQ
jgi:hypothetical protein